jgi:hypothetical protein
LWARAPARRSWVATGPKPKPGGAGGWWAPGPLVGEGRRPAQGLLFKPHNIKGVRELQQAFAKSIEPVYGLSRRRKYSGSWDDRSTASVRRKGSRQALSAVRAELDPVASKGRVVRVSSIQACVKARSLVSMKIHMSQCTTAPHSSALFELQIVPSNAAMQPTDERNWFGPKCSHDQQMA